MNQKPKDEIFEGYSGEMRADSPWLAAEDIDGRGDVKVTIVACHRHKDVKFEEGRSVAVAYSLEFKGKQRRLILNVTNRRRLVAHFGPDVKAWAGKEITLYIDPKVRLMGKTVSGIRIR